MARRRAAIPPRLLRALGDEPQPLRAAPAPPATAPLTVAVLLANLRTDGLNATLGPLLRALEDLDHDVSTWLVDADGQYAGQSGEELAARHAEALPALRGPLRPDLKGWAGADVVLAPGWRTVPTALRLPATGARVALVPDYEPDLVAAGAERQWAAWTYEQGLPAICGSDWLAGVLRERHGADATAFVPGLDHGVFRSLPTHRRGDLVLFHAPPVARRGLTLGLLALQELHRRRPEVELGLYGSAQELVTAFPHTHGGVLTPPAAAGAYSAATVGLSLSFTAPAAVTPEMLACGLPVVELATDAVRETYGDDLLQLAALDPHAVADAVEQLLDDLALRADRARAGIAFAADRTWADAGGEVERALRAALVAAGRG